MFAVSDPPAPHPPPAASDHVVQFYEEDGFIVDAVADFLDAALVRGGTAILIATPDHCAALQDRLVRSGEEQHGSPARGELLVLDARGTLARFMVGGLPDRARFMASVGRLVMRAGGRGARDVRAYGEMVALLCEDGNVPAAIALEELWNGLAARQAFALMCGYPLRLFSTSDRSAAFGQVCAVHARVRPAEPRLPTAGPERDLEIAALQQQAAALADESRRRNVAENAVRQRDELLMLAPLPAALLTGRGLVFQLANPPFHALCGSDQLQGRPFAEALPGLARGRLADVLARAFDSGEPFIADEFAFERAGTADGGATRIFKLTVQPLRGAQEVDGLMLIAADVTELVQARRAMEVADRERSALMAQLETASRAKDEFLAMLGHELRNPLSPIVSALQLMRMRGDPHSRHEQAIIQRQVEHLIRLVDDLLDVARITRGTVDLRHETVPLAQVLARSVEMASLLIEQRQHVLTVEAPAADALWSGDPMRLAQVVSNLLTNAARYTPPGGRLALTVREHDGWFVISVRDNGKGIEPDVLPRVFDLFYQGRQGVDRPQGGLGIGLALVRNLVELHGGTVEAHSGGPGQGSEFIVRLPAPGALREAPAGAAAGAEAANADDVRPGTAEATRTAADPREAATAAPRILVVDDNEDAAETIALLLEAGGHRVAVANDPLAALALARSFEPELALLDLGLPVMDGYELAGRLRQECPGPVRLLALTGYGQPGDRERTRAAGFDAHLVKPVDADELLALVQGLLDGAVAARQEAA